MKRTHSLAKPLLLLVIMSLASAAIAQKAGGTLRVSLRENPGSVCQQLSEGKTSGQD